ncbi:hypothetical protein [Desulfosporosinus nitroreducens]|uniref:Uncharacterized protein n=1 Tax=Desulfosporosinus nitroreducens TaxID=2018668 RepID=A0ABT8QRX6_9FIRM|nr:hypothetical protein [Desulfosporosinus nitroreducens]MCO1601806.1 hypothetical protein [Desulfosporosinus nitroreducens]MDO0823349.1 hypothetical protein [Desulfosporosinus nitroreducens]
MRFRSAWRKNQYKAFTVKDFGGDVALINYCQKDEDVTDFMNIMVIEFEKRDKCRSYLYFDEHFLRETGS